MHAQRKIQDAIYRVRVKGATKYQSLHLHFGEDVLKGLSVISLYTLQSKHLLMNHIL